MHDHLTHPRHRPYGPGACSIESFSSSRPWRKLVISRCHPLATTAATGTALTGLPALAPSAAAESRPTADLRIRSTTVEYATHPLGLDTHHPRLSWILESDARDQSQSAYRIRIATSPDRLGDPDVWESGKRGSRWGDTGRCGRTPAPAPPPGPPPTGGRPGCSAPGSGRRAGSPRPPS